MVATGTLYVVASPLGNLGDVSERARTVLNQVDVVAAEDTRRTRTLLAHVGASPKTMSVHAHTSDARISQVLDVLRDGGSVALVTDAGTPGISDPGAQLVRRAREGGANVVTVPGPSAAVAALSISGLPADRYVFWGFPPRRGTERREALRSMADSRWTVVAYEAPGRVLSLLEDLLAVAGEARPAAVARELTKVHEECRVGTLGELVGYYRENPPRGEVTLMLAGRPEEPAAPDATVVRRRARALLAEGLSRRDAAARLASELGVTRNAAYRVVTAL